ncbi:MAG: UDP-3-O-(3-hydroxymyristoyl)glucosamine N-acyltransferase [Lactobacillaceae bacterium]|jgi:UDP-3-O-[3-hydroxymyristoyl] glucosamine N-acyltransferase|nr:UDP-3-O-(3-hydroxymyristoyl)glucosamine N-acyltransferase [Lactobacillaceae bacterium]
MVDKRFFINNGPFNLAKIAEICDAKLMDETKGNIEVSDINTMLAAGNGEICFFYDKKSKEKAKEIKAAACITNQELADFVDKDVIVLISENPKLSFFKLNYAFYEEYKAEAKVSDKASIHKTAKIGNNCTIGDYAVIGENAELGDNCVIEPNVTIAKGCVIGSNCRIGANAALSYCIIGNGCYIYTGARIGADGFGFNTIQGQHKRIPQLGRVIIGNDVEIGANTCVDRGALDDTVIGNGVRVDNLAQIAHGDKIGDGCIIVAQVGIAGSSTLGKYVVVGGQVGVADHIHIEDFAQIAAQSGIMRNVESGAVVMGTPAVPIKDFMRQASFLQKSIKKS